MEKGEKEDYPYVIIVEERTARSVKDRRHQATAIIISDFAGITDHSFAAFAGIEVLPFQVCGGFCMKPVILTNKSMLS